MSALSYQTPGAGVSAIDQLMRKRARKAESHLSTRDKRPKPRSPLSVSLPESYIRENEGIDGPFCSDPSKWSSAVFLGPRTGCAQHDGVASTPDPGFATHNRGHFDSAPAELFPTFTYQGVFVGGGIDDDAGNGGGNDCMNDDTPSNKLLKRWPASTAIAAPPPHPLAFVSPFSQPPIPISYDVHAQTLSMDSIEPFHPRSNVAEYTPCFTGPGFGIMSTSFEPLLDLTETSTLLPGNSHVSEDDTSLSAYKFPAMYGNPGHVHSAEAYLGEDTSRLLPARGPLCGNEAPGSSLGLVAAVHLPPLSHVSLAGEFRSEDGPKIPDTTLAAPNSQSYKATAGEKRSERTRRPRGQLLPKDREETSKTRKWKACIRCRMQKIRCIPDPSNPETECCVCCQKVLILETKKVIHRIPCLRWNLNEVVLFRVGGLGFTKRWTGVCVENIDSRDWANERVITIGVCITKLLCDPIPLKVRKFKPNSTDIQHRHWRDQSTEAPLLITTPAYALADVNTTAEEYRRYVWQNAEEAIRRFVGDTTVDDCVRQTFSVALRHSARAAHREFGRARGNPAKLFHNYFRLWFASRFTLGSAYVADGQEKLEQTSPTRLYRGKQFVSRMITAQFDSIGYKHVLVKLKREVLDELWLLMQKRTDTTFFTVYLIVFMMLHEISVACEDRRRRAKEQGLTTYYDLEDATAKIKHGAEIILSHWHYYKGDLDPLSMSENSITRAFGTDSADEIRLLMATCRKYEQMRIEQRSDVNWEDEPLYLVSRMFEYNWRPI
ncbi:hypothetical protein F4861DRAFT_374374 [Xylaria intraflava]|nr:hypothetical protein F4861DRAFT_374374 [Xylaria intraflava]